MGECVASERESDPRTDVSFPSGFLWGTSSAAQQVEGDTTANQWWAWEQATDCPASRSACEHYQRYPDDVALMAELGYDAYRFSIEWSRIEPEYATFPIRCSGNATETVCRTQRSGLVSQSWGDLRRDSARRVTSRRADHDHLDRDGGPG